MKRPERIYLRQNGIEPPEPRPHPPCPGCGGLRGAHMRRAGVASERCPFSGREWSDEQGWVCDCGADFCEQDGHSCDGEEG